METVLHSVSAFKHSSRTRTQRKNLCLLPKRGKHSWDLHCHGDQKKKHPVFSSPRSFELHFKSQENLHYSTQKREPTAQHSALSEVRGPILTSDFCPFQSHTIFSLETSPSHQEDLSPFPAGRSHQPTKISILISASLFQLGFFPVWN